VIDDRTIGPILKVSNLANLVRHAKHDTLIIADADMRIEPGYIRAVVRSLVERASDWRRACIAAWRRLVFWASTLGAMFINEWFFPGALIGTHIEPLRQPRSGATIACRRATPCAIVASSRGRSPRGRLHARPYSSAASGCA